MLKKSTNPISLLAWLVAAVSLIIAAFLYPKWTFTGTEAVLSWDVFGYYLYLPALFIYNDLGGLHFLDGLMAQYQPAPFNYHAFPVDTGNYIMKYSMGQSIFYLPFFFMGHLWAKLTSYPADGLSYPYQASVFFGAICYALAGLALMRNILLRYFSDKAVAMSLILLVVATNYLNYVSFDGAMTHNHLFTLYAALLYLTIRWHQNPTMLAAAGIGLLCGLASLTRPTEVICVLLPIIWGVYNKQTLQRKWQLIMQHHWQILTAVLIMVAVGSLQLIYWKYYSGHWLVYSYEDQGFSFLRPHLFDGLFSFKKGWLVYTPIMAFALAGLVPLYLNQRQLFWAVAIFNILNIYITFSWDIWWYGGSFGSRAMVQSYAVWLIPFAAFCQWALARKLRWLALLSIVSAFIWLNLVQTYECHIFNGAMHPEGLSQKYWVEVFIKQKRGKELRKYLDLPFEAPDDEKLAYKNILTTVIPTDTVAGFGDKRLFVTGKDNTDFLLKAVPMPAHTNDDWVRVSANIYYTQMEWDEWKMARLGMRFYKDGKERYFSNTRLQWLFEPNTWYLVEAEMPLTYKRADADSIALYFENPGQTLYVDTIKLELLKAK